MVVKENPENEEFIINDGKDSLNISGDAAYLYFFDQSLMVEIGITIENNSMDTLLITNTDSLVSKYYSFDKRGKFPKTKDEPIVCYPKSKKEVTGVVYWYETKWPFPYGQKGWPKLPEDEEITFKLPTLIKGNRQITFKELHFILPKE